VNYINNNNNYHPQQNQWNQQQRPNYQGNYQGNFQGNNNYSNYNRPPLRDLVAGQSKLLDQMSKKIASNDKVLENINSRMDTFTSAIKNQHSFNKMLESQLAQLATAIPPLEKGKKSWSTGRLRNCKSCRYSQCSQLLHSTGRSEVD
jgi:hypothetical protein